MSIAVSAVIVPSRRLRWLLGGMCASLLAAALAIGWHAPARFAFGGAVAFAPLFAALALGRACLVSSAAATVRRIDISGLGQIRLTVQQGVGDGGQALVLAPGSTVWPGCMVLRLRADDGAPRSLLLLPDSVSAGEYRALAVALRARAGGARSGAAPGAHDTQIL